MVVDRHRDQRITRLAPLADVLSFLHVKVKRVAARRMDVAAAAGRILAQDVTAPQEMPSQAIALRDGYALRAETTADASPYGPAPLPARPARLNTGSALPEGHDCIAPPDAIEGNGALAQVTTPLAPGDGVLPAGGDMLQGQVLCRAGAMLRARDCILLAACGVGAVQVCAPRIEIVSDARADDTIVGSAVAILALAVAAQGGVAIVENGATLSGAFGSAQADAVIGIGGTGCGENDRSVQTLAGCGEVAFHGIGLMPGETTAVGLAADKPVLILPGRIDAALAGWLMLGRPLLRLMSGARAATPGSSAKLTRKIASTIGIVDIAPVLCSDAGAEPLAGAYWPLQAILRANGVVVVPAGSEGFPAGAQVTVETLQ